MLVSTEEWDLESVLASIRELPKLDEKVLEEYIPEDITNQVTLYSSLLGSIPLQNPNYLEDNFYQAVKQKFGKAKNLLNTVITIDTLTGLKNRNEYIRELPQIIKDTLRHEGRHLSYLMIDIDFFKYINDTYGHSVGDEVLGTVAQAISHELRGEQGYRYGGEEFVYLLEGLSHEQATKIGERVRQKVENIIYPNIPDLKTAVSIGISNYTTSAQDVDISRNDGKELLTHINVLMDSLHRNADRFLYISKNSGRNKVTSFSFTLQSQ